ncbi:hypothetical protein M3J09_008924 [Ascochyta lentis]
MLAFLDPKKQPDTEAVVKHRIYPYPSITPAPCQRSPRYPVTHRTASWQWRRQSH